MPLWGVAGFFDVTPRTIDNYIERCGEELRQNGYEVLRGKRLAALKLEISQQGVDETDFVNTKVPQLGVFDGQGTGLRVYFKARVGVGRSLAPYINKQRERNYFPSKKQPRILCLLKLMF